MNLLSLNALTHKEPGHCVIGGGGGVETVSRVTMRRDARDGHGCRQHDLTPYCWGLALLAYGSWYRICRCFGHYFGGPQSQQAEPPLPGGATVLSRGAAKSVRLRVREAARKAIVLLPVQTWRLFFRAKKWARSPTFKGFGCFPH